jgi:hypothetical protein
MNAAFITYIKSNQKKINRAAKQQAYAVAQTAKEGKELNESALVNAR